MNNGISSKAPEKEQIKSDFECLIRGMNSTGMIDCIAYDDLFDEAMPMFDQMYEQGKKEAIRWHPYPQKKPASYTKNYLLTVEIHYGKSIVRMVAIDTWADSKQGGEWEAFDNNPDAVVTAWLELPEPYKQGAQDE